MYNYIHVCTWHRNTYYSDSVSSTYVSGLLHALVAMCLSQVSKVDTGDHEDPLPIIIISFACRWKQPRKHKDSSMKMSEATFQKHVHGRQVKHTLQSISEFDPRPSKYRGTASQHLKEFLKKVKGMGIGVSLIHDNDVRVWKEEDAADDQGQSSAVAIPSKSELTDSVLFKENLHLTSQQIRELERNTKDQHQSPLWFFARRYRITASSFGRMFEMLPSTHPDSLVK